MRPAERLGHSAQNALSRLRRWEPPGWLGPFGREPLAVLGGLVAIQWIALVALAFSARHNGWLFYQGGDQTYYYTTSWLLSNLTLPTTPIGWVWPFLLTPVSLFAGSNVLAALPAVILIETVVLLPVATFCVYGIAARIAGRLAGYWTALLFVVLPYAAIPLWDQRYHEKWVDQTLPQTLGFGALADFPSMVGVLVAAYFAVRALDTRASEDAALAGLATGLAVGLKPANALFVAAPVLALVLARAWRQLAPFAAAIALPLITLLIWKERGLGRTPALAYGGDLPLASLGPALPTASFLDAWDRYVSLDWGHLRQNLDNLREFFWSVRPLEFVPFAGALALARRSWPKAVLVAAWFFAFFLFKATAPAVRVEDASFFRLLMPAYPAFVLLLAAIPLLVPRLGPRAAERFPVAAPAPRRRREIVVGASVALGLVPLVFVAAIPRQKGGEAAHYFTQGVFVPVSRSFQPTAEVRGRRVRLDWNAPSAPAKTFFVVFRSKAFFYSVTHAEPPAREGLQCLQSTATAECRVHMDVLTVTRERRVVDRPPPGRWTYRIGLAANWKNDPTLGDVLLVSAPATLSIRR